MDPEQLLAEFKKQVEQYATELAQQMNLVTPGGQIKIEVSIVPAPDVIVIAQKRPENWRLSGLVEMTYEDIVSFQEVRFRNIDYSYLRDLFLGFPENMIAEKFMPLWATVILIANFNVAVSELNLNFRIEKRIQDGLIYYQLGKLAT